MYSKTVLDFYDIVSITEIIKKDKSRIGSFIDIQPKFVYAMAGKKRTIYVDSRGFGRYYSWNCHGCRMYNYKFKESFIDLPEGYYSVLESFHIHLKGRK